ncbi:triose-phosphate isomerase [Motiliproteus coralliicola]|uniref:Triosephosphate isomerase n=1 Tax=Motiliproteus coralliicola TaxID=2283196 RepID=A0A369WAA0_9GAMM|nr:triose-phosphate isomerase [Motiliproteus coralliicola]RDE18109.1 triose-phosphate isomerase [Motiliproteus coralliicola]
MRQPLVAGNWKMNGSQSSIAELMDGLKAGLSGVSGVDVAVCPSAVYLDRVGSMLNGSSINLGAQTVSEYESGAYTGENSVAMLKELDCRYVIVGHSERRSLFGETDAQVVAKYQAVRDAGLTPILCVGETLEEREQGRAQEVIASQVGAVLDALGADALNEAVVAYEPVWAIGTGKTATPDQAQEVHAQIRAQVAQSDAVIAEQLLILYGGSVNAGNAETLFSMADIDGGLVGGASLKVEDFVTICRAATNQ